VSFISFELQPSQKLSLTDFCHALLLHLSCILVTFFLTRKLKASALPSNTNPNQRSKVPQSAEDDALAFIDTYGSYIDIHTGLVIAGQLHSRAIVDKLLCLAKYDSKHREAVTTLEGARTIFLYEPVCSIQFSQTPY
jgi:hypothetical protein